MLGLNGKKDVDMLSGSIVKGLLTIAIPIMIMNVVQSMFNIVDMTVLKTYDTELTVGAVGACGYIISLMTGLVVGLSSGANVVIARFIGQGDKERVERAIGMLQETNLTKLEIAAACGFCGSSNFYKAFQKITGKKPSDYT